MSARSETLLTLFFTALLFIAAACSAVALAHDAPAVAGKAPAEVSIPFANHGGIDNWHVADRHTVYIEDTHRKWYKAVLMGDCFDINFAEKLGFESNPDGSFDRFSAIRVRGQRCPVVSLTRADSPFTAKQKGKG